MRAVTLAASAAPYGPLTKEKTPSAESLRERKGSGGPKAATVAAGANRAVSRP